MTGIDKLGYKDVSDGNFEIYKKEYSDFIVIVSRHWHRKSDNEFVVAIKQLEDEVIIMRANVTFYWLRTFDQLLMHKNNF